MTISNYAGSWLVSGDTAWQITAATLVGLMSIPGLAVFYGGVMQKRWSINSMMLTFGAFSTITLIWVLYAYKMGFGHSWTGSGTSFFDNFIGKPGPSLSPGAEQSQGIIPTSATDTGCGSRMRLTSGCGGTRYSRSSSA